MEGGQNHKIKAHNLEPPIKLIFLAIYNLFISYHFLNLKEKNHIFLRISYYF